MSNYQKGDTVWFILGYKRKPTRDRIRGGAITYINYPYYRISGFLITDKWILGHAKIQKG